MLGKFPLRGSPRHDTAIGDRLMLDMSQTELENPKSRQEARLRKRLKLRVSGRFPVACAALDFSLDETIEHAISRARGHGLRSERDLAKFLDLAFLFGLDFDELDWATRTLERHDRGPTDRINQVYKDGLDRLAEATGIAAGSPGSRSRRPQA